MHNLAHTEVPKAISIAIGMTMKYPPSYALKKQDVGKEWPQIVAILSGCLLGLQNGLHYSWTSPFFVELTQDKQKYDISEEEASYFTTLPSIVQVVSSPLFAMMCDHIGRKATLLISAVPFILAWILEAFATDVYMFHTARCLTGLGAAASLSAISMYIGEISSPKVRSFWGNFFSIFISFGVFFINLLGFYFDVRQTAYICLLPALLFVIIFPFMPESPYYLLMKGHEDLAKRTLQKLTRKVNVEGDFVQLKADVKRQMSETGTWKDLLGIVANRKALIAGVLMRSAQQFCGAGALAAYTRYIFEESSGDAEASTLIYTGVYVISTIIAGFFIDHLGRKASFIISMLLCATCLLILSIFYYIEQFMPQMDVSSFLWLPLLGMMAYVVFSCFGVLPIPTLMLGELFSASIKAKGLSVLIAVFGLLVSLTNYLFYWLTTNYGIYCPFLTYSLVSFALTAICIFVIPETKGKTLEEIQQELNGNVKGKT